nr:hypothetical protein [Tanacetum cinerariifolium]
MGDKSDKNEKDNLISLHYPMLTRSNYAAWAIKMRDKLALAAIYQGIPEDLLLSLAEKQTAKDAWETLKTMFMGAERVKTAKVQTLKAEFETLSMKDTEIIDDFGMKVNNIVSNIPALGEKVEEAYVVKKLLRAVSSKFLQIASTIEQFADLDNMTVEEVIGRLKSHEERVRGQSESGEGKLLLTHQEWLERSKKKGNEEQRTSQHNTRSSVSNNRGRGRGRGRDAVVVVPIKTGMEDEDLQKFPVLVENETGVKVKTLRTDHGGEFNSKAFTKYCDDTGLKHHFTAPYSPQQNGVVERRNLLVIEMARSMMKSMEVPDTLWGEAVRQAVYIQNRVPTKTLGDMTPYERWSGKNPNLEHLRVFGCVAHSKVLRGHQQKLDSRSEMLVHLGTKTGSKAYRLLDPVSERIQVSRDVRFDEGKLWKWSETTKFKESPRSTFTIEGYSQEDTILEDENDPTDEPLESFEGINDEEFQPTPQTHIHGDDGLSTPTQSSVTSVDSTSPASSTTGGGAPKRYRLLTDIYKECDELLFMQDVDEPTSYLTASKDQEWVKAMKVKLDAIEKNQT